MKDLRKNKEEPITDYVWCKKGEHNAVVRTFGKKWKVFWFGDIVKEPPTDLDDCSVKYIKVNDERVFEVFKRFTYEDLTFTASVGKWYHINPLGVNISRHDIDTAYRKYKNK